MGVAIYTGTKMMLGDRLSTKSGRKETFKNKEDARKARAIAAEGLVQSTNTKDHSKR